MFRIGLVGLGWWGSLIVRLLNGHHLIRVVAGHDISPQCKARAQELGIDWAASFDDLVGRADIDAVLLCTPPASHFQELTAAVAAGKHVFCEKPFMLTRSEAVHAVDACASAGLTLAIGHERRFEQPVREAEMLIKNGSLGKVLMFEANFSQNKFLNLPPTDWRFARSNAEIGPLTATGIHLLDLAVHIMGPASQAFASYDAVGTAFPNGDTFNAQLRFFGGGFASITAMLATPFYSRISIFGTEGWIEVTDKAHPEDPKGSQLVTCIGGVRTAREWPPSLPVVANIEAFMAAARGKAPYPMSSEEIVGTVTALEAVLESARRGTPVKCQAPT